MTSSGDDIRAAFAATMSAMYRAEVPAYGTLIDLVERVNEGALLARPELKASLEATDGLDRILVERHGAIRLGTAAELAMMRRVFAVMGMYPVGYYDLSTAGVPVHATAFRPVGEAALKRNPFRVFTSLLRLDLIADETLREAAALILAKRRIFTGTVIALTEKAERDGGLSQVDADRFVAEVLETFRWQDNANVDAGLYRRFHDAHRLIADVVSFKGPHINHLTLRTLDIDQAQAAMPDYGIAPKAFVEGPPMRACPILLRQTSFKALEEPVSFKDGAGGWTRGSHTARFGEIEQRGIALTPKGRGLYDRLLEDAREIARPAGDGSNAHAYQVALARIFEAFPDDWDAIRRQGLGYFFYSLTAKGRASTLARPLDLDALIEEGFVQFNPIIYEDFLPVSAAGIFQSNLGDGDYQTFVANPHQKRFEEDLGTEVLNEFDHYVGIERASLESCLAALPNMPPRNERADKMSSEFKAASRIASVGVSKILQIGARAAAMKRDGLPVIILGAGEPDFDTPPNVKDAAKAAIDRGETKYTALDGTPALKKAICDKFRRENCIDYALDEVTVGTGAKQILFNAFMASLDPGDEVIIPTPYWTSYSDIVEICGGVPVLIPCGADAGFRLTAEQLETAITPKTRWVLFNSPSNPSGAAYSAANYRPLLDVLLRHPHVWLMVDDMYEHIVYDGFYFVSPVALEPRLKDRTLTINGVSKAYAMTGWRIGYAGGPKALIKAMAVIQSQATSCPCSISQAASIEALTGPQDFLKERRESFQRRRDIVVAALDRIAGLRCRLPEGAFYTFSECAGMLGKVTPAGKRIESDADFTDYLLEAAHVAVVPGSAFGLSPYFRISYATSEAELIEALDRLDRACAALR